MSSILVNNNIPLENTQSIRVTPDNLLNLRLWRSHLHVLVARLYNGRTSKQIAKRSVKKKPQYLRSRNTLNQVTGIGSGNTSIKYEKLQRAHKERVIRFVIKLPSSTDCMRYIKYSDDPSNKLLWAKSKSGVHYVYEVLGNRYSLLNPKQRCSWSNRRRLKAKYLKKMSTYPVNETGTGNEYSNSLDADSDFYLAQFNTL